MNHYLKLALLVLPLVLGGCAATVRHEGATSADTAPLTIVAKSVVVQVRGSTQAENSADWQQLRATWRSAITSAADARGLVAHWDQEPPQPEQATLLVIRVNSYRYISAAARLGVGVFTGNAFIDAEASFYELPGRKLLGTRRYNTASSAWQGILAPMTVRQVEAIAGEIAKELAGQERPAKAL